LIKEENPKLEDLAADWFTEKEIKEFRDEFLNNFNDDRK
jgi:hypothetical protein